MKETEDYKNIVAMILEKYPGKVTLTVRETAEVMSCAKSTVYKFIGDDKKPLPTLKNCKAVRVPIPALARWMCF